MRPCGMPDRLDIEIDPYVARLSHPYGTLAFVVPLPSNAGAAETTVENEQLAPLMECCPRLMMLAGSLTGLDNDRSKRQRAHRGVALGKVATPLREGLPGRIRGREPERL